MIQNLPASLPTSEVAIRPAWTDFATQVIDRLTAHHGGSTPATAPVNKGWLSDDLQNLDEFSLDLYDDPHQIDMIDYADANGENPHGPIEHFEPLPVRLPTRELSSAIRLTATFQSQTAFMNCLFHGAVTVVEGFAADDLDAVAAALTNGLVPLDWRLSGHIPGKDDLQVAVLLRPEVSDGEVSRYGAKQFLKKLDEALEGAAGVIVLCPNGTDLPAAWRDGLPKPLQMAPLSQDVLTLQLHQSHAFADIDEPAVRRALPSNQVLATLPYATLRLALRKPSAFAVANRLSELTQAQGTAGIALRDLVGYGPAKDVAIGIAEDLVSWARGDLPWSDVCRGLLVSGPPGVGKTELARALSREGGLTFVSGSYADWQSTGHLGDFLNAMAKSFATAIAGAPAILFLDEIDTFSSRQGIQNSNNASYNSKCVAGLLQHLDGVKLREGVVVIAATNYPSHVDPAVVRAGRFDQHIAIGLPSHSDLEVILRQHLKQDLPQADLHRLASLAIGSTGADIASAVRSSRGRARQGKRDLVEADLAQELAPTVRDQPPAVRWRAALHEAGHAIAIAALGTGRPVCLRLNSDGGACIAEMAGALMTSSELHQSRMIQLAGRSAELLVLGDISAGAGGPVDSDLAMATLSALKEETTFGMGNLGSIWLTAEPNPMDILRLPVSVQRRLGGRIADAERDASHLLKRNRILLEDLARALEKCLMIEGVELEGFLTRITLWNADGKTDTPDSHGDVDAAEAEQVDAEAPDETV